MPHFNMVQATDKAASNFFVGPFRVSVIVLSRFALNHICHHWPGGMLGQK